jgi:hypothetical protein
VAAQKGTFAMNHMPMFRMGSQVCVQWPVVLAPSALQSAPPRLRLPAVAPDPRAAAGVAASPAAPGARRHPRRAGGRVHTPAHRLGTARGGKAADQDQRHI